MTSTHTYATLEIPKSAHDAVAAALKKADPQQYADRTNADGEIDMQGIALVAAPERELRDVVAEHQASGIQDVSHRITDR